MVRLICPNCSNPFQPAAAGAPRCPKCGYQMGGAAPTATMGGPVFAPAGGGAPTFSGMPPPAPYPVAQGQPGKQTNGMALTSMILGIIGVPLFALGVLSLLAFIFGIVGIVQTKKSGQKGTGMAVTGIVLGALVMIGQFFFWSFIIYEF